MKRLPLLWRVFLSTSLVTTVLFVLIAYLVQSHALRTADIMLSEELQSSFRAYQSVWQARSEFLGSLSKAISGMPDVRAAFGTGDRATIRDTASDLWARVSPGQAVFLVTDPNGEVISGGIRGRIMAVNAVAPRFPKQGTGFLFLGSRLHQVVITPVYVEGGRGPALISVLVAGFPVDQASAESLKSSTGGTDVLITAGGRTVASTLPPGTNARYSELTTPLTDVAGMQIGELHFLRPFTGAVGDLRAQIAAIWAAAILFALVVTYFATRRLLGPIRSLDAAAREVARGNYDYRVPLDGPDEMGRLGHAFNAMCQSIRDSREELIRQERVNTLGRIATAVVHDLRNPLAAIYSGAELLVDGSLPASHTERLASNIYRSSRQVLNLLDDLTGLVRGRTPVLETCRLSEIVEDAWNGVAVDGVSFSIEGDPTVEAPVARARLERVFTNLFANSVQAMPTGGRVRVELARESDNAVITVRDTGPGVPQQIRRSLFQPFTTAGKSNGVGLGLTLSRQTVAEHGGTLTLEDSTQGACFRVTLPAKVRDGALQATRNA